MRIIKETNLYHCFAWEYDFKLEILDFCRYLKTTEGWKNFGFWEKKWRFSNPKIIDIIRERYPEVELDETATASLTQWQKEKEKELEAKERANQIQTKTISSLIVEGIKGELYNYQKTGIEFLINSNGRAIISDPMGSGKSCMSLGYVLYQKFDKILVVCPASVKFSWESETIKWTNLKSFIISSRTELTEETFNKYQIFIINYDILKSHLPWLINHKFDALILDESQYVKSNTAIRTKLVKKIAYKINHRILLSGTPLLSRPVELFNSLSLIDPYIWNDWHSYTIRYCQGHQSTWGWDARGASNLDELRQRISHYFLRRKKEDILPELPPKRFIDFPVEMKGEDKFVYEFSINS
jgi:SNF2 family DNA or RNA helicase